MTAADASGLDELKERMARLWADAQQAGCADEVAAEFKRLTRVAEVDLQSGEIPKRMGMVGDSPAMQAVLDLIEQVAPSEVPVLILGETGTGKELVARALHDCSRRADKPFLAENCAAVAENLLESEFFGHKKGSFTGAFKDRPGHFVAADGGTVFLDEIGDMPLPMQAKLLRVLQDGEVRPVGSNKSLRVDVRVLAATNKDLAGMCADGSFREDLYFRLNVISVKLPPLRERAGDVRHLIRFFIERAAAAQGEPARGIGADAVAALEAWSWPGNIRELENEVQRAVALSQDTIGLSDLSPRIAVGV